MSVSKSEFLSNSSHQEHTITLKHYIVFNNPKLIFNFDTKQEMDDWLIKGQSFVNEHNGKINKCVCKTIHKYGITNVKLKSLKLI
jgi:hypothetical protein